MYGVTMQISHKGQEVTLRALSKDDLPELVKHFSSMKIHMYTKGLFAQTLKNEMEWYEKNRKDRLKSKKWLLEFDLFPIESSKKVC